MSPYRNLLNHTVEYANHCFDLWLESYRQYPKRSNMCDFSLKLGWHMANNCRLYQPISGESLPCFHFCYFSFQGLMAWYSSHFVLSQFLFQTKTKHISWIIYKLKHATFTKWLIIKILMSLFNSRYQVWWQPWQRWPWTHIAPVAWRSNFVWPFLKTN